MKLVLSMLLLGMTFSSQAFSNSNKNLDAIAMMLVYEDIKNGAIEIQADEGGIFDQIKEFLDETKEFLLDNFDYNGNGRIDFGQELDDTITAFKEIATILIDLNQNGTIEKEEIVQLLKDVATLIKDEISAQVCPEIIERAEKAGRWLKFRPVLNALYKQCT